MAESPASPARTKRAPSWLRMPRAIWWAAALPPLVWMEQGTIGWILGAHSCPEPVEPMRLGTARIVMGILTLVALAISVTGLVAGWRTRQALTRHEGEEHHDTEEGTRQERVRFVANLAVVTCATLTLGLLLFGLPAIFIHTCGEAQ